MPMALQFQEQQLHSVAQPLKENSMMIKRNITNKKASNGFTLIEMAMVILIAGLLILPLLQAYKTYTYNKELEKTQENMEQAKSSLNIFLGRYPCPSDRSLPSTSPNYGVEKCTGIPTCTASSNQGICRAPGSRDADGNGVPDPIIIGGVPFKDGAGNVISGMVAPYILDGWGNKLTYIVSESLMVPRLSRDNDFKLGVISAINEHGNPTAGVTDNAQFALISHGKDANGAFSMSGNFSACPAGSTESENCDNDSIFVSALGAYEGTTATYYDDVSYFILRAPGELWVNLGTASGSPSPHINNLNTNNIGINLTTPTTKLDVNGTIQADAIRGDTICDKAGTASTCLSPNLLNTPAVCPAGQIITKISGGSVACGYPSIQSQPTPKTVTCNTGKFITAIVANGCIVCNDGATKCP